MATIMDISLLDYFTSFFVFIFIWVFFYAMLSKLEFFGKDKKGINALIAACVGVLVLVTSPVVDFIKVLTPWFAVLLFVFFCFIMVFMLFGIPLTGGNVEKGTGSIAAVMGTSGNVWTMVIILIILLLVAITQVFGPAIANLTQGDEPSGASFVKTVGEIVFSPKVLSVFFLLLVAAQTVRLISSGF